MRPIILGVIFSAISITSGAAYSEDKAAIAVRASTLGIGGEFSLPISEKVNFRAGIYGFSLDRAQTADNINYDLAANLFNAGAMLDYYPFNGIFHLSGGAFYSTNKVVGDAVSGQNMEIGNRVYTPNEVGTLHGKVSANTFAPYLGMGWGKTTRGESPVKFLFDVGVMFHGMPEASLTPEIPADSPLNLDPAQRAEFDANLEREVAAFQNDIASYKLYPVVSLGLGFKF